MAEFLYQDLLPLGEDTTPYRLLTQDHVSTFEAAGRPSSRWSRTALACSAARGDARHRPPVPAGAPRAAAPTILDDPEASPNDRFVALELLKNANIAAGGVLPSCQDTGTAIVMGKKGQHVLHGRRRRGGDRARRLRDLPHGATCATRSWRRSTCTRR